MLTMKSLLAWLLAFIALPALAQTTFSPTWAWVAPSTCADGTAIAPTATTPGCVVTKYTLYTGLQGAPLTAWGTVGATTLSVQTPGTPAGVWCGQVTASDATGESAPSNQACITLSAPPPPVPGAPSGTTVTLAANSTIAYMLVPGKDTYGVLIVGSVPLSTPCVATKPVLTYYVVPTAQVTFTTGIKSPVVLATCS